MSIATQSEINQFLFKFKFFAQNFECFSFIERDKNLQSLAELGITSCQAINIILQLTYKNYSDGPEPDVNYPGHNVWKFGYNLDAEEIYIKLSDDFGSNIAKCISFHKADFIISYPYKNGGE